MIIRRQDNDLLLFRQVDHGSLAGELVDLWGNERFAAPTPLDAVRFAATLHDEGWRAYDAEPLFNEDEHRPLGFAEIDQHVHIPLYKAGVDEVYRQGDLYAGLVVSMHWTGLYRSRWGLQPIPINWDTTSKTPVQELQDVAITEQEHYWVDVKRELLGDGFRSDFETNLWHNFDLMQAFDLFSIFACVNVHTPTDHDEPELLGFTLRSLDQVPGARLIPNVPTKLGGERVDLVLRAVEPGVVAVDPYPFKDDEVALSIEATAIPDRHYADAEDARAAVEAGEKVAVECRMIRR